MKQSRNFGRIIAQAVSPRQFLCSSRSDDVGFVVDDALSTDSFTLIFHSVLEH
jgi:hypothetical protein